MVTKQKLRHFQVWLNKIMDNLVESYGSDNRFQKVKNKFEEILKEK